MTSDTRPDVLALAEALAEQQVAFFREPESFESRHAVAEFLIEAAGRKGYRLTQAPDESVGHPDAGNIERNHYAWFMPDNPTAHVDALLDDFEAKMREALTDPFAHDMAQTVLPLIAAYRACRADESVGRPSEPVPAGDGAK